MATESLSSRIVRMVGKGAMSKEEGIKILKDAGEKLPEELRDAN